MWHSMMCVLTWKPKVTPRNRLLFQLAVSKLPTEETESGSSESLWATPQAMDGLRVNQVRKKEELSDKAKKGGCSNLREQVMWRTPDAHCGRGGSSKERMEMKLDKGMPISLNDQVAHPNLMWPTPASRDWKGGSPGTIKEDKNGKPYREAKNSNTKWGLTLDAAVEYQQKKMWPTPTTMDSKEDSLKHATKMLQGKTHRASGQPIQKTLADKIMMEEIRKNPELMELYQDHQMVERPHLPEQQKFVKYLRSQTTIKELAEKTDIKKTTIEHWFRKDKAGFSHCLLYTSDAADE